MERDIFILIEKPPFPKRKNGTLTQVKQKRKTREKRALRGKKSPRTFFKIILEKLSRQKEGG